MKKNLLTIAFCGSIFFAFSQLAGSGKAYDFSSTYLNIPNSPSLNPSTSITIEAWIKADSYAANSWENVILSKDGWGTGNQGYTLRTGAGGVLSFNFSSAGVWKEVTTNAVMTVGNWYHVAGTYDGTTLRVYVNGVELNSLAFTGPITNGTYDVTIGKMSYLAGGTRYFDGQIDEVKIWSSALTETQIRDYMCRKVSSSHPQFANLIGYWNLDQSGAITDQSSNGNNGVNVGASQVNSGAPIGDASVYSYLTTANLSLNFGSIDTAKVSSTTSLPLAHLYRIDALPLVISASATIDSMDQTHYYGVYVTPTPASNYNFSFHYGANPLLVAGNENYAKLAGRTTGSTIPWAVQATTQNQTLNTLNHAATGRKEFILALSCPPVNITPGSNQNLCEGDSITLLVNSSVTNIQWFEGSTAIPGANTSQLIVQSTGIYHITGNDGICASTSPNVNVTVHPIPTVDFGDLPSTTFCVTEGLQNITNSVPTSGGIFSGPGIFSNTFTPNMAPAGVHTLYYNFTDTYGCHNLDSLIVTLGTPPPTPVISVSSGYVLCVPACGTFTWSLNGNVLPGTDSCYTATANGTYSVSCMTAEGCTSPTSTYIVSGLGLETMSWANGIEIGPNPTSNFSSIILPYNSGSSVHLKLINMNGKVLVSKDFSELKFDLDLSSFESGLYFLSLSNSEGEIVKRLIKE